ncbi:MAG: hypothetical protein M3Y57_10430 [Acidobacteriota bacterium]|nr:hypothetical protein [Acidobacteriota bacterium]
MGNNSLKGVAVRPTPVKDRKGIKITDEIRALYAAHDHSKDDPEAPMLPAEKWANAMRRDEFFRPIKKADNRAHRRRCPNVVEIER